MSDAKPLTKEERMRALVGRPVFPGDTAANARAEKLADLVEAALHLRLNGEHAPGGNETWEGWVDRANAFLDEPLEGDA